MELIVYAPVWGQSGYEQVSRGLLLALDQMGVDIELRPAHDFNQERVGLPMHVISRLSRMMKTRVNPVAPHVLYQIPRGQQLSERAPVICYTLFETDRCPQPWLDSLLRMDKILVFSEFNRKSWSQTGIPTNKISRLPVAIDSFLYNPDGPKMNITNAKDFNFLMSGDFTERKNFEAVIEAFVTEFTDKDPVSLIVKCHYAGFTKRYRRDCANRLREIVARFNSKNPPRILFWGDKVSDQAMASLYRSADCFVLASRGEGLGMQYLEAMASGLPIIHCNWSAHTDFLDQTNSYPVSYTLKTIDDPNYIVKCPTALNGKWAQVDIPELKQAMRHVFTNQELAKQKAQWALRWVRAQTWQKQALSFVNEVVNLYSPVEGVHPAPQEVAVG